MQTTWLERGAVMRRVALLPRSLEAQPLFRRFVDAIARVASYGLVLGAFLCRGP